MNSHLLRPYPRQRTRTTRLVHSALFFLVALSIGGLVSLWAQSTRNTDAHDVARQFEIKPLPKKPEWAEAKCPPLLTFAWISDCHLSKGKRYDVVKTGFNTIRDHVIPDLAVITGDNSAYAGDQTAATAGLSLHRRRQLAFRRLIDDELQIPVAVIPGDNWHTDFHVVFGSDRYSFDAAGLHLVFVCPDAYAKGAEGLATFDESTWRWLQADLTEHADQPTILFMHQNVVPPTFLESTRITDLLRKHPQVIATMTGHLHLDLEFRDNGITHLVCPSMGLGATRGFKVVQLHADRLVINTYEYDAGSHSFKPTMKWQRIAVPESLRKTLHPVRTDSMRQEGLSELPPRQRRVDPTLLDRRSDMFMPMMQFLVKFGYGQFSAPAQSR